MKKIITFVLTLFVSVISCNAQTIISQIIPSGQRLYFRLNPDQFNIIQDVTVCNPNGSAAGWSGYPKPAGDVVIPDTIIYQGVGYPVVGISSFAFKDCNLITSIVIPNTVTTAENNNNYNNSEPITGCTSLTTLTIGRKFRAGRLMKGGSPNLKTIFFHADSCVNPYSSSQGSLGIDTVSNVNLIIGDSVKFIPNSFFYGGYYAHTGACGIKFDTIIVGSSVNSIGSYAFREQDQIQSITFRSQNPPLLGQGSFLSANNETINCNVPCGRSSIYYAQWTTFFNDYVETNAGYSINVSSSNDSWGTAGVVQSPTCSENAMIGATAACGYYFVRWSDGNSENPRTLSLTEDTYLVAEFASSYNVPDTVFVHDTTTINNYLHDTTYLPIYLHDTVPIVEYFYDTIFLPQYLHDTTFVFLHDTIYIPQYFHDTTIINHYLHDTLYIQQDVHDTIYVTITDTLWLHDTVFVYDTIYIHDTIVVGVGDVETVNAKIYTNNRQIVVEGADGNDVWLYDVNGRILAIKQDYGVPIRFDAPASGTYMIKIGDYPARKVVVIR